MITFAKIKNLFHKNVKQIIMNRYLLVFATVLFILSSCNTKEKVLYFQDVENGASIPSQTIQPLKLMPGDKLSIVVSSSATPELAMKFNLPIVTIQAGATSGRSYSNQISLYTIDENGCIDIPTVGRVKIGGSTRSQAATYIQTLLREGGHLRDAVVTISAHDQYVTVMGEVKTPGRILINRDNMTILEAIGQAGDLNIQARRDRVLVIRQEGNQSQTYYVDLRSKDILNSPVYNLKQNDVIYVEPNNVRMGQSTNNDNSVRSISTWLSVSSVLISLGILIFR